MKERNRTSTKNTRESDLTKMEDKEEEEATANLGPRNLTRTWVVVVVVGIWFFLPCVLVYTQPFFFTKQPFCWGERCLVYN